MQNTNTWIRRRWANLEGRTIGNFAVTGLSRFGANRDGSPNWELRCSGCDTVQARPHSVLTAALESNRPKETLRCENQRCKFARVEHTEEQSLRDIRKQEREQKEQAEREQASRQRLAAMDAQKEAEIRAAKVRYLPFAHAQIRAGVPVDSPNFVTFERWQACSEQWRANVLNRIGG